MKRFLKYGALVLTLALVLSVISVGAFAVTNTTTPVETESGAKTYTLFNSGRTGAGYNMNGTGSFTSFNSNANSLTNDGYDIFARMGYEGLATRSTTIGLSFHVNQTVTEQAVLTVNSYDTDETDGERDHIYLVDETTGAQTFVGYLSGMNDQWNTTALNIGPSNFTVGHTYHFMLYVDSVIPNDPSYTWYVFIRNVSLQLTTAGTVTPPSEPEITDHNFSATIDNTGFVNTELYLKSSDDLTYTLEYAATIEGDQHGSAFDSVTVTTAGVNKTVGFQLESGSPRGTYRIDVILKDSAGNVVTTYTTYAGYGYSTVTYNANGGSNNLPADSTAYSTGDTVTVKFDYLPSKSGYTFAGWSTSATATTAEYTANGTKTFTIGSTDVTLYAVWTPVADYGDVNGDGVINGKDVLVLRRYLAGTYNGTLGDGADVNGDGEINKDDLTLLQDYIAWLDYDTGVSLVVLGPSK